VIDKINEYYNNYPGCAGRSVHKIATKVSLAMTEARVKIQKLINAREENEIIFLRNTTEAMNLVANGINLSQDEKVLTTDHEHNSNLAPWLYIQQRAGRDAQKSFKLEIVPSKHDNTFNLDAFEELMDKSVKMVSMAHTANLDGYTIPAQDIIKIAHEYGAMVMLDGAQSAPHKPVDVQKLDVDFFAFSSHKMCGPSGIGVLYGKRELLDELPPFIVGGSTVKTTTFNSLEFLPPPDKFEAGLQNYAGIVGTGAAAQYLLDIGLTDIEEHNIKLNRMMTSELVDLDEISLIGPKDPALRGNTFSFNIKGVNCHDVAMILDEVGNIMIRSGMHCVHSWFNHHNIDGSARAAVYLYNTEDEIKFFNEKVREIIKNFK
jgi:cysteine desulfurase/selenocysteine lyase